MKTRILSLLVVIGLLSACTKKSDDVNPQPAQESISFQMAHFVGSQELQTNTIKYTNAIGNVYSVETLKYFISDIVLNTPEGGMILIDEAHYVDIFDPTTLVFAPEVTIPTGEYTSITFIFGLDEEKNVPGEFPNPPENNMEWPPALGTGYHYMKLEGKFDSADIVKNYQCHTGPTNNNQNYITVTLPNSGFVATGSGTTITLAMDINNWWVSPNTLDLNNMSMVMGNQPMQVQLHDNGRENVFSVVSIE